MLLEAKDLRISYRDVEAVHGVSFHIEEGELISIIGANGAGKTSILNAVMGIIPAKGGTISYQDHDITALPAHHRARLGIRIVPERARVFPLLTVLENIMTGLYGLKNKTDVPSRLSWTYDLFPVLKERSKQLAQTLSGGEQQQLAIARALVSQPKLLLVDEVSMGLMPILVDKVFDVLRYLNKEENLTILLVEQNALASLSISHRAYVLETGVISLHGDAQTLKEDPAVKKSYLGA
ncbi:MAG: ABC transporter ATP-binding protein [Thermovirgaceae bacterium]|nr:ABC transporter ATP-binding protein [Thermovirgaceae bacterium]